MYLVLLLKTVTLEDEQLLFSVRDKLINLGCSFVGFPITYRLGIRLYKYPINGKFTFGGYYGKYHYYDNDSDNEVYTDINQFINEAVNIMNNYNMADKTKINNEYSNSISI